MKILFLGSKEFPYGSAKGFDKNLGGGTSKYVQNLIYSLIMEGHSCTIITRKFNKNKDYEKHPNLTIFRVRHFSSNILRLISFNIFSFLKAFKIIARKPFDIIHSHGAFASFFGLFLSKFFQIPSVSTPHGLYDSAKSNRILNYTLKLREIIGYQNTDAIIFLNENEKLKFKSRFSFSDKQVAVIDSGIVLPPVGIQRKLDDKRFTVTFIGRLVEVKNVSSIIDSLNFLPKNIKRKVYLEIVGDGYLFDDILLKAKNSILKNQIKLFGFDQNVQKYYLRSSLFILPSNNEGFPISLLEAMSYGVPCLINDFGVPFNRSLLHIMPNSNPKTIAFFIEKIFNDLDNVNEKAAKAKLLVHSQYSFSRVSKKHITLYNSLLQNG